MQVFQVVHIRSDLEVRWDGWVAVTHGAGYTLSVVYTPCTCMYSTPNAIYVDPQILTERHIGLGLLNMYIYSLSFAHRRRRLPRQHTNNFKGIALSSLPAWWILDGILLTASTLHALS
jgi:hypothetical protein